MTVIKLYVQIRAEYILYGVFFCIKIYGSVRLFEDWLVFVLSKGGENFLLSTVPSQKLFLKYFKSIFGFSGPRRCKDNIRIMIYSWPCFPHISLHSFIHNFSFLYFLCPPSLHVYSLLLCSTFNLPCFQPSFLPFSSSPLFFFLCIHAFSPCGSVTRIISLQGLQQTCCKFETQPPAE